MQVRDRLARMVLCGEHVKDRNRRMLGKLGRDLVRSRPDPDRGGVAREHVGGVADRLAATQLQVLGAQHHRVPAELEDAGLERDSCARRRPLEDQSDRPPGQGFRAVGSSLELKRAVEHVLQICARELGSGEEVAGQGRQCTFSRVRVLTWNLMHGRSVPVKCDAPGRRGGCSGGLCWGIWGGGSPWSLSSRGIRSW